MHTGIPPRGPGQGSSFVEGFLPPAPARAPAGRPAPRRCKRLSCDRRLPVRFPASVPVLRYVPCQAPPERCTLAAGPQHHAAPQALQRRGERARTQEGERRWHWAALGTGWCPLVPITSRARAAHGMLSREPWCWGAGAAVGLIPVGPGGSTASSQSLPPLATVASPVRGLVLVPCPAPTPARRQVGWVSRMHRPPGSAWVQAGVPVGPVGLCRGGQRLPLPMAPRSVGGRLPFPAGGTATVLAHGSQPGPRSKVSAVEAVRGCSSVMCIGRFLRQHRTERRKPPAAPVTSTAASQAPGTAGPGWAGFGNSARCRGPAHDRQRSRQSHMPWRLLHAGKLPGKSG